MFHLAFLIGIYSYLLFLLGIFKILYSSIVIGITILYILISLALFRRHLNRAALSGFKEFKKISHEKWSIFLLSIFALQLFTNLIGALGPELAFDALWYHLTLPKLYLLNHSIYHIPGGLLYYSDMPKLGELLYIGAIAFGNEISAKLLHFSFGILTCLLLYKIARQYFSVFIALIAVLIFYSNLVVAWESITAYIDLIRAFFEIAALAAFLYWWKWLQDRWLFTTAFMVGLAIASKLLAVASLVIFSILILYKSIKVLSNKLQIISKVSSFISISLLIPLPWFIFSYFNTGNPIYPIFSDLFQGAHAKVFDINLFNPFFFLTTNWNVFTHASDPITPLYMIFLPLLVLFYKKIHHEMRMLYGYGVLALCGWYTVSQVEGARLLLPYLPAFSLLCAAVIDYVFKKQKRYGYYFPWLLVGIVVFVSFISIGYRFVANYKYIPVIIGQQSKSDFLSNNLEFSFADFYDTDGYFIKNIGTEDRVLLYGFHNLYYVDFPFIHASWIQSEDRFNYIATQRSSLPKRFANWQLLYTNDITMVNLYGPPEGDCNNLCVY